MIYCVRGNFPRDLDPPSIRDFSRAGVGARGFFLASFGRERAKLCIYNAAEPESDVGKEAVARLCGGFGRSEILAEV